LGTKLVVANDIHYQGTNPRGRVDNYPAAIKSKLHEVFQIADTENARAILISGDICNTPEISRPTYRRLSNLLRQSPCEILTIHGSPDHDGLAAAMDRQWYPILTDAQIVRDVEGEPWTESTLVITGKGANPETDHGLGDYLIPDRVGRQAGKFYTHLSHGMALERAPGPNCPFRFTLLKDIAAHPNAPDVLVCSHFHPGWGIKRIGRTLFINVGALARNQATVVEMERTVQIGLLEIDPVALTVEARLIPLQSAQPGHTVLSREHLEAEARREENKSQFMATLGAGEEMKRIEVDVIFDSLNTKMGFPADVLAEARRRYALAQEGARA
jgi:exonuclease SbcD